MEILEKLGERLSNLLCIKSIITLALVFFGLFAIARGLNLPDWFVATLTLCVKGYWDAQESKKFKEAAKNDNP